MNNRFLWFVQFVDQPSYSDFGIPSRPLVRVLPGDCLLHLYLLTRHLHNGPCVRPFPFGTMASADFCRLLLQHSRVRSLWLTQISPGKNINLHLMYPPHLPLCVPDSLGLRFVWQTRPRIMALVCDFCSSGRGFATGFLQIPPHDGHPCL
jgi:hypothetical protein